MLPVHGSASNSFNAKDLCLDAVSLVKTKLSNELLFKFCVSGSLRASSCRSVVWRILLRCLPYDQSEWESVLLRNRQSYGGLKKKNITDPHDERFSQDPQLNNPLAPIEQNPWHKYFADSDLRDIISKDVSRTFPEIEFFQSAHIRKMMSDILLIYAKENSFVMYKQGMHEILAPIMFVIFSDLEAFEHSLERGETSSLTSSEERILRFLFSKEYLEHDCYNVFSELMLDIVKWYEDSGHSPVPRNENPYMRLQDAAPTSRLMSDLNSIGKLLEEIDPTLSRHLKSLDIPPQLYGIRWLRLLFGRELPLNDLLYLWDVLLADRPMAPLVQCIFVSMLVQIRHLLLPSDYGGCLQYLMRYPPIADMDSFVQLARHYRNPKKIARPNMGENNFSHLTVAGKNHPNLETRGHLLRRNVEDSPPTVLARPVGNASVFAKVKNTIRDRSNSASVPSTPLSSRRNKPNLKVSTKEVVVPKSDAWGKEIQLMEEQVSCLQTRLNERDLVCSEAARAIENCARDLSKGLAPEKAESLAIRLREISRTLTMSSVSEHNGEGLQISANPLVMTIERGREVKTAQDVRPEEPPKVLRANNEMIQFNKNTFPQM
ncbi:unnamed protein product [Caenorhabditis auriculariae]|uniref:Rab-GAP TBC domain-containing protein n=1 Tax=Caenorhabditis auriculariae TaxID=2777116 RepID=A0A8S1HD22_9PELO|nr:unnamed protein product [Caenorhabditis auriculariae]